MKNFAAMTLAFALVLALQAGRVCAEDATVTGTVSVTEENNEVKAITITDEAGKAFSVVIDEKAKKLAAHKEKKVTVTGATEEKEGVTWITVKGVKPAGAQKTGGGKKTGKKTEAPAGE
ncbi:MAG: hypothetical protein M5U26_17170 [Planctomycetota bacterium]|nr:hypothetical protein [Planctomycetota bacterium]